MLNLKLSSSGNEGGESFQIFDPGSSPVTIQDREWMAAQTEKPFPERRNN